MKYLIFILLLAGCAAPNPFKGSLPPPTQQGIAAPTPTIPLKEVAGLMGSIPSNTPGALDMYVRSFDNIAFESEFDGKYPWVLKYTGPIKYFFYNIPARYEFDWRQVADTLAALTGIEIVRVKDLEMKTEPKEGLAFTVTFPREQGGIVLRRYTDFPLGQTPVSDFCFGLYQASLEGEMYGGTILLYMKDIPFRECVVEEMSQLMGLTNDSDIVADSLFRNDIKAKAKWLTWHDAILLRTLYDFRLKPGMPRAEALPIVRVIIGELLAEVNRP